jgi:hypothetical protein
MKKFLILMFVLMSQVGIGQKTRAIQLDADTTTRPSAGMWGIGVRSGVAYLVPNTGNTRRVALFTDLNTKANIANPTFTGKITTPDILVSNLTPNQLVGTDASDNLVSLSTATYPSLAELAFTKGLTSNAQTQINSRFTLPSLTNGSVLFSNGATIAQNNAQLFWDNTNNRLGVGVTNPYTKFQVQGIAATASINTTPISSLTRISTSGVKWSHAAEWALGSYSTSINSNTRLDLNLNDGAINIPDMTAMTWLGNGNVGIGKTNPSSRLHISSATGDVGSSSGLTIQGTGTGAQSWQIHPTASQTLMVSRSGLRLFGIANDGSVFGGSAGGTTPSAGVFNLAASGNSWINGGSLGLGTTALTGYGFRNSRNIVGSINSIANANDGVVQSTVTSNAWSYFSNIGTQASSFTLGALTHYYATQGTIGAGSTVTNQVGFSAESNLVGATNNYGFLGAIPSGTNRWNLFMNGTAQNYMAGPLAIGSNTTSVPSAILEINNTTRGVLLPRMTTTQINAIASPANGLMVYNTTLNKLCVYENTAWRQVSTTAM